MATGSVVKRGRSYSIVFYDQDGKQRWKTIGPKKAEADKALIAVMGKVSHREYQEKDISFSGLCDLWLDSLKGRGRKRSTLNGYRTICDLHLKPYFRNRNVRDISTADVEAYVTSKLGGKLSNKTVGYQLGQLKMILKRAVIWGYTYKNVCEYVERPTPEPVEVKILSNQEVDRLLATATGQDRTGISS